MGFLILAVACSLGIATLFTLAERRDLDRMALLTVNYAVAAVLALQGGRVGGIPSGVVVLGIAQGVLFIGGFWLFSLAIRQAGMGLAAASMRLSIALPVAVSWAIWGEAPTPVQGAGMVLAGVAFALLARPASSVVAERVAETDGVSTEAPRRSAAALLVVLFVTGGLVDVLMKAFQVEFGASVNPATFLLFVFAVAFMIGASAVVATGVRTGRWPRASVLLWGVGLGVLNYASSDLFLRAVGALPAPVAFPLNSALIVLGAALLGRFAWGERFTRIHVAGLALATLAVALLAG